MDMLSKEERRAIFQELSKEFSRPRSLTPGLKEAKLKAAAQILGILSEFTTPQQGQVLRFCMGMVASANDKFWRDNAFKEPAKR